MKALRLVVSVCLILGLGTSLASASDVTEAMSQTQAAALASEMPRSSLAEQSIYFVMPDRYANGDTANDEGGGNVLTTGGFAPKDIGYFHGGDLKGLRENLGRIQAMGFTALWITPVVVQRAVQGSSAAYHGYWGLDFTTIDPHFGTEQDFRDLVSAVHGRGMKLYLDIVVNHTADVINPGTSYIPLDSKPYLDSSGKAIDLRAVDGLDDCTGPAMSNCWPLMTVAGFPHSIDPGLNELKAPAFLQDVTNYHNRGNIGDWTSTEQKQFGDFGGLDDLFSERPAVWKGEADLWANWVTSFGVDGFRIDTVRHLDDNFFKRWTPLVYQKVAAANKPLPQMFGESVSVDWISLANVVRNGGMQSMLDFSSDDALVQFAAGGSPKFLQMIWKWDDFFNRGSQPSVPTANAYSLVTFMGNHDEGRFAQRLMTENYSLSDAQMLQRMKLGFSTMMLMRGTPTVYYGDEVGMLSASGDKEARQDMFPTQVAAWRTQKRIGSSPIGTASSLTNTTHPLLIHLTALGQLRKDNPALVSGAFQPRTTKLVLPKPYGAVCKTKNAKLKLKAAGFVYVCKLVKRKLIWTWSGSNLTTAWSRFDADTRTEYVVAANSSSKSRTVTLTTASPSIGFTGIFGSTAKTTAGATGALTVTVPAASAIVFKADAAMPAAGQPSVQIGYNPKGDDLRPMLTATVTGTSDPATVTFVGRYGDAGAWFVLGVDDANAYRFGLSDWITKGHSSLQVAAIVKTTDGKIAVSSALSITL